MDLSIGRLTVSHSAFFWNDQRQPRGHQRARSGDSSQHDAGPLQRHALFFRHHDSFDRVGRSPPITFNSRFELSARQPGFFIICMASARDRRRGRVYDPSSPLPSKLPAHSTPRRIFPPWPASSTRRNSGPARCRSRDRPLYKAEPFRRRAAPRLARSRSSRPPSLPSASTPQRVTHWTTIGSTSPTSSSQFGEARRREHCKLISKTYRRSFA